jgi:hypothetical protein
MDDKMGQAAEKVEESFQECPTEESQTAKNQSLPLLVDESAENVSSGILCTLVFASGLASGFVVILLLNQAIGIF